MKLKYFSSYLTLLFGCFCAVSYAEEEPEITFKTIEVGLGLYMLIGEGGFSGGNIGLSVGDDGVIMIDDSMPPMLDKLNKTVQPIAKKPIDYLINTHVHGDHTGNNTSLGKLGVKIFAQENVRKRMLIKNSDGKSTDKAALPVFTFNDGMTFHINNQDAQVFHVAHAHTDGDSVIYFKQANIIHTGDTLFNRMFPFIDLNKGGSLDGYIAAQQRVLALADDQTKIIPGHGQLANKADLLAANEMLMDAKKIIAEQIKKGLSEEEVVKHNPLQKYDSAWSWNFINTEKMTRQVYQGIQRAAEYKTIE
ncbi:MAG: NADPH-quinone reductase [Gammaproteobacteria bacterium CG22_combo_CG10-13_8_21_14_all_40_8]|nr:MAG: NADPH-quinone reductase [Gammaproteobacteria bacterium CG22_combo_CG10-13_8_21_14_all_40_8]